jgi:hypothetical protein
LFQEKISASYWYLAIFGGFQQHLSTVNYCKKNLRKIKCFNPNTGYSSKKIPAGFPVSHVFLVLRNTKLTQIHHQFREILHVSRIKIFREISFCFVNSKISVHFGKFHLDSLRFATFHLVSYRFAKFHLVFFRFADIQTVSFHKVNILIRV